MRLIGISPNKELRAGSARKYALAVVAVALALGLSLVLFPAIPPAPGALLLTAMLWVSIAAGRGPGILATLLSALSLDYFFYPPRFAFEASPAALAGIGCYVLIALVVGAATDSMREASRRAEAARAEVETLHQQLRAAVEAGGLTVFTWEIGSGEVRQTGRLVSGGVDLRLSSLQEKLEQVHPDDREAVRAEIDRSLHAGDYHSEHRVVGKGGEISWVLERGQVSHNAAGAPQRLAGASVDITEREQAEEVRRRLAAIVESSEDAIIGHTLDGTITTWNQGAERLYGYSAEEAVGRPTAFLMPVDGGEDVRAVLARVAHGEHVEPYETVRIARDGRRVEVSLTVSPIRDREGRIVGVSKIARDVTERRQLERTLLERTEQIQTQNEELDAQWEELLLQNQELEEQDRFRNEFLAMLAHELRNPLAPIVAATEVMRMGLPAGANPERQIAVIARQARHLARLVNDLLDVSRITRGKVGIRPEGVDLVDVVEQAVQTCDALVRERKHQLVLEVPADPVQLEADPTRLLQVVCNLINNAAKYTDPGGQIHVSVVVERDASPVAPAGGGGPLPRCPEAVAIRVRDNGRGIEPRLLPRVFELFVQGEQTPDRSEGGLGIGLTLVRSLVELHGGSVEVFSEGLGRGCEFVVRLPLPKDGGGRPKDERDGRPASAGTAASARGPAPTLAPSLGPSSRHPAPGSVGGASRASGPASWSASSPPSRDLDPFRVLVVEDNEDAAQTLAELLRIWDYDCRVARSGVEALEMARAETPAVVLLDIGLPGMDGYEVAQRLRQELGYAGAVIALSGYGQDDDRRRSRAAGFDGHLTKPVDTERLRGLLSAWSSR